MRELPASPDTPAGGFAAVDARPPTGGQSRLAALGRGARGTIMGISIGLDHAPDAIDAYELERRLLEMGFVEGARFEVLHEGPVGRDPMAVKLDDTRVALRRRDAGVLLVETDKDSPAP